MGVLNKVVGLLVGVVLLAFAGTAWADGDDDEDRRPEVAGTTSTNVTSSGALLRATVHPQGRPTTYQFEYGPTAAYGSQTPQASAGGGDSATPVSAPVTGLQSSTTYHYRIVATNSKGSTHGPDRTFTTLVGAPGGDPGTSSDPGTGSGSDPGTDTDPGTGDAAPAPELGKSVLVAPGNGRLRVRRPGSSSFEVLELGSELPVGTEVDARESALALTSALPSGATQTGRFGGGRFVIRQGRRGYVDLYLKGRYCSRATTTTASSVTAVAAGKPRSRRLWGSDHGGRFRTHGKNSHATVRGTRWLVADSCRGTLTHVTNGSVVVTDTVRHKRVTLEAGERYLARPRS